MQSADKDLQAREVEWLQQAPDRLLSHYQFIIEATVARFAARGFFAFEEKEEIVQEINLQLWEKKLERIKAQYNGSVYLRTYFSKVVYNACLEIARSRKRQPRMLSDELLQFAGDNAASAFEQMAIRDELHRLEGFFRGLEGKRPKSELCLKLFVRFILSMPDIRFFDNPRTQAAIEAVRQYFFEAYDHLSDKEVYGIIVNLFNFLESRDTDADSLRKWVQQLADRLIGLLNGDPPVSAYDRETLKILLRLFFEQSRSENVNT